MDISAQRKRGRPPKRIDGGLETRQALVRAGVIALTEKGFAATGIDDVLTQVGVPKGSFYHYFASKEAFGAELIDSYAAYFDHKLDRWLGDRRQPPLGRLHDFMADARRGMQRHDYRRGCLVGNLGQEMAALPESFRARLIEVLLGWQQRLRVCLEEAQVAGELAAGHDCAQLAGFFWIGWEGAVLRAKLERRAAPLDCFSRGYLALLGATALEEFGFTKEG